METPKNNILLLLIAVLCVLFIGLILMVGKIQDMYADIRYKDSVIAEKNATIQYHVNKEGKLIAEKEAAVLKAKDIEKSYPALADAITKQFDIKLNKVKVALENSFTAHGQGTGTVINNHYRYDSSTNITEAFIDQKVGDKYLDCTVNLELKIDHRYTNNALVSNVIYEYAYTDTARTVFSSTKKWFQVWKNEKIIASTMFSNPNAKILNTTNILVDNFKDKRWVVSIGVTAFPSFEDDRMKIKVMPGIHAGYTLFKF